MGCVPDTRIEHCLSSGQHSIQPELQSPSEACCRYKNTGICIYIHVTKPVVGLNTSTKKTITGPYIDTTIKQLYVSPVQGQALSHSYTHEVTLSRHTMTLRQAHKELFIGFRVYRVYRVI